MAACRTVMAVLLACGGGSGNDGALCFIFDRQSLEKYSMDVALLNWAASKKGIKLPYKFPSSKNWL